MYFKWESVFLQNACALIFLLLLSLSALAQDVKKGYEVLINFSLLNEKQIKEIKKLLDEQAMKNGITRQVLITSATKGVSHTSPKTISDLPKVSKTNLGFISRVDFLSGVKSTMAIISDKEEYLAADTLFRTDTVNLFSSQPATALQQHVGDEEFARKLYQAVITNRDTESDTISLTNQIAIFNQDNLQAEEDTLNFSKGHAESSEQEGDEQVKYIVDTTIIPLLSSLSKDDFRKLFVVDFFPKQFSCVNDKLLDHGCQVTDVIKIILTSLKLEKVLDSIHLIPINFFDHIDTCFKLVKEVAGPELSTGKRINLKAGWICVQ